MASILTQCACGNDLPPYSGKGRYTRHCSEACKQRAKRVKGKRHVSALAKAQKSTLHIVPCSIEHANKFVQQYHLHLGSIPLARFAVDVSDGHGVAHGVATMGLP